MVYIISDYEGWHTEQIIEHDIVLPADSMIYFNMMFAMPIIRSECFKICVEIFSNKRANKRIFIDLCLSIGIYLGRHFVKGAFFHISNAKPIIRSECFNICVEIFF